MTGLICDMTLLPPNKSPEKLTAVGSRITADAVRVACWRWFSFLR